MSEEEFKTKLEGMTAPEFEVLWDRCVLVVEEAKRRGLLATKSDDLFQKHLIEEYANGHAAGDRDRFARCGEDIARVFMLPEGMAWEALVLHAKMVFSDYLRDQHRRAATFPPVAPKSPTE